MTFSHIKSTHTFPKVKRKNINHVRHYVDEEYNIYHSVTKVVGSIKDFEFWYDILEKRHGSREAGMAVAEHIKVSAGIIGTKVHKLCEAYLNNKPIAFDGLLPAAHFENLKHSIDAGVDNIRYLEIQMFSKKMGLAGTADVIADWDGMLSVIDIKTTKKQKSEEDCESYFLQSTAYALMYEENTGVPINQIVIVFTGEDGSRDTWVKRVEDYEKRLFEVIAKYKIDVAL